MELVVKEGGQANNFLDRHTINFMCDKQRVSGVSCYLCVGGSELSNRFHRRRRRCDVILIVFARHDIVERKFRRGAIYFFHLHVWHRVVHGVVRFGDCGRSTAVR